MSSPDSVLLELVNRVESNQQTPPVTLQTAGSLIVGTLVPALQYRQQINVILGLPADAYEDWESEPGYVHVQAQRVTDAAGMVAYGRADVGLWRCRLTDVQAWRIGGADE